MVLPVLIMVSPSGFPQFEVYIRRRCHPHELVRSSPRKTTLSTWSSMWTLEEPPGIGFRDARGLMGPVARMVYWVLDGEPT